MTTAGILSLPQTLVYRKTGQVFLLWKAIQGHIGAVENSSSNYKKV